MFAAGRFYGHKVQRFRPIARILTPERFEAVQEKFEKYGTWVLFVAVSCPVCVLPSSLPLA
jgi:membrane protein DedA with SNARE-associated domain